MYCTLVISLVCAAVPVTLVSNQKSVLQTKKLCLDWSWLHLRTSCEQGGGGQCGCICPISNFPSPFQTARSSQNIMNIICSPTVNNTHVLQLWRDISQTISFGFGQPPFFLTKSCLAASASLFGTPRHGAFQYAGP